MGMREKRKYKRAADKNIVLVTLMTIPGMKDMEGRTFTCTTADISLGGVRLISNIKIPVGTTMELRVAAVSPPAAFRHIGRVNWQLEVLSPAAYFVGIEFTGTDESTRIAWYKFIETKLPTPLSTLPET